MGLLSAKAEEVRVDDFIQSGYSGGGRSFSVDSAEGIRSAIDAILSDILDASGRPGERVIEQVANVGSSVSISTMVLGGEESVEESCSSIGTPAGGVYVLNALDGGGKRTFDIDGDGRLDDVAMVFTATGGYGRGHVLASIIPAAQMTPAQLRETQLATQHGEGDAGNTSCRAARFALVGVNNGAISGGVQCSQSWARQQYQLTRPPQ